MARKAEKKITKDVIEAKVWEQLRERLPKKIVKSFDGLLVNVRTFDLDYGYWQADICYGGRKHSVGDAEFHPDGKLLRMSSSQTIVDGISEVRIGRQ